MKILTTFELKHLSFPDCLVTSMIINCSQKKFLIETDSGHLELHNEIWLDQCKIVITDWKEINTRLYRTHSKSWEKLESDKIEMLDDICRFKYDKNIFIAGFGRESDQWIEIIFTDAKLEVLTSLEQV